LDGAPKNFALTGIIETHREAEFIEPQENKEKF
jgi:hypothetical protein